MICFEFASRVSLSLLQLFVVLAVVLCCNQALADDGTPVDKTIKASQPAAIGMDSWPPTDPMKLLQIMKQRDAVLANRILRVEERWVERINPTAIRMSQQFSDLKLGRKSNSYPAPSSLPDAYDQPHRRLWDMIVRDSEVTLKNVGDLEERLNSKFGTIDNAGAITTNVGGSVRSYSPRTETLHVMGSNGGMLMSRRHAFEWCTGHGFAKLMSDIDSIVVTDDRIIANGSGTVFDIDNTTFELEIDQELIVRRAVMSVPSRPDGFNDYRVTTQGTTKLTNAPAVAKHGISQRVLRPAGKPERDYTKYDITFVSLSDPLRDEEYSRVVEFKTESSVRRVDIRPLKERHADKVSQPEDGKKSSSFTNP